MPKFVSGSSGHVYSQGKLTKKEDDDIASYTKSAIDQKTLCQQKPSAINKKGTREQQKSSLDLFKEELKRLNQERDEERNKQKQSLANNDAQTDNHEKQQKQQKIHQPQTPICIPLKPDPRCPTTLTLQVNLNPRDKDSSGSFDTGDPSTTNLYLGNLNPSVNENDLCDIFGKFGPLASIKVMWPRTDEERARNRNSGFVAYMSRIDAERALRTLNGMELRGYDLKLGWGKAVPLPQNPVFVPLDLKNLLDPPPYTGLPFNAQLNESDLRRKYRVPNPFPRPPPDQHSDQSDTNKSLTETYDEFMAVFNRSTVRVVIPQDRELLDRIHKTIEYLVKEGPVFEAIIIGREANNPEYKFLSNYQSYEHVYYRWKLYSILNGDNPYKWRTDEFRMYEGGPMWKPPPINPFAGGMPVELIERSTGVSRELLSSDKAVIHDNKPGLDVQSTVRLHLNLNDTRQKGALGHVKRPQLEKILVELKPTRSDIGTAMMFCINHSDAAQEVIDCIHHHNAQDNLSLPHKVAIIFLISDILHNCSAAVTNASYYRKGFQTKLESIFENLYSYLDDMVNMRHQATDGPSTKASAQQKSDNLKQKILSVLGAWREWTLYEDEFIIRLSDILLGIDRSATVAISSTDTKTDGQSNLFPISNIQAASTTQLLAKPINTPLTGGDGSKHEDNLDGDQLSEEVLIKCLEEKGLSLRWYKTLELSDDEEEEESTTKDSGPESSQSTTDTLVRDKGSSRGSAQSDSTISSRQTKFKTSKWETVDPNEVAEQVVRLSKWEQEDKLEVVNKQPSEEILNEASGSSTSFDDETNDGERLIELSKRKKFKSRDSSTSSSSQ